VVISCKKYTHPGIALTRLFIFKQQRATLAAVVTIRAATLRGVSDMEEGLSLLPFFVYCGACSWYFIRESFFSKVIPILLLAYRLYRSKATNSKVMCIGMLASSIGDVCLQFEKDVKDASWKETFFLGGLVNFAVAHILYIVAYWHVIRKINYVVGISIPITLYYALMLNILLPACPDELFVPVIVYASIIAFMVFCAIHSWYDPNLDNTTVYKSQVGAIGAFVFLISDTILALGKFTPQHSNLVFGNGENTTMGVMITYYMGQYFIAESAMLEPYLSVESKSSSNDGRDEKEKRDKKGKGKVKKGKEETKKSK
jgi:uncharacterized membrane protein YhhN